MARLTSLEMRKNVILNVKSLKKTTDMINSKWANEKVFINERLTKFKRMLFSQKRLAAKSKQYKFMWLPNSDILVRKNENSNIVKIR